MIITANRIMEINKRIKEYDYQDKEMTKVSMTSVPPKLSERTQKLHTDPAGWVLPQALFSGQRQAERGVQDGEHFPSTSYRLSI